MLNGRRLCGRALVVGVLTLAAAAISGNAGAAPQNMADGRLAVHGYDVVAYFTLHRPLKGVAAYEATYRGVTYRFASTVHRTAFLARPEKFVPQYGGYCAWSMRTGQRADVDPAAWEIVGGRLFLMRGRDERSAWMKDMPAITAIADGVWERLVTAGSDP